MEFILSDTNSIANQFIYELRNRSIQKDSMRFRKNFERLGEIMAYELSKSLKYNKLSFQTPLAKTSTALPMEYPVLGTILRAGLTMHQGLLNVFDQSESAFLSAFRKESGAGSEIEVEIEYLACPSLKDRILVLSDPMLATGTSMVLAYKAFLRNGTPAELHVVSAFASREGLAYAKKSLPQGTKFWLGAVDSTLNEFKYIVPGLGDAGDLAYGNKR